MSTELRKENDPSNQITDQPVNVDIHVCTSVNFSIELRESIH